MSTLHMSRHGVTPGNISTERVSTEPTSFRQSNHIFDSMTPISQTGCFEFDRIIKSGYLKKRTGKTKTWKEIYLVLRPSTLSIYKNEKESKLRRQIHLTDLTAIAPLIDRKQKRHHIFGLFTSAKNYHLEAPSAQEMSDWVEIIRREARIEEEEDELFLASASPRPSTGDLGRETRSAGRDRVLSSSPEPPGGPRASFMIPGRRISNVESSGFSGNELASHSDLSDFEGARLYGASIEDLAVQHNFGSTPVPSAGNSTGVLGRDKQDQMQAAMAEHDLDRVIWQGKIKLLRTKGGVRQWKSLWGVLRPRVFILYKDETEYIARWVLQVAMIVNVVDMDPMSKSKRHCFQIITEEKSYRLCAPDEESLVQCMGAFKSLLAKRRAIKDNAVVS